MLCDKLGFLLTINTTITPHTQVFSANPPRTLQSFKSFASIS
jgi:hypothetical protein